MVVLPEIYGKVIFYEYYRMNKKLFKIVIILALAVFIVAWLLGRKKEAFANYSNPVCDANLFALGFEFFDVIEYHLTDLRAPITNVSGVYITIC